MKYKHNKFCGCKKSVFICGRCKVCGKQKNKVVK